MRGRAGTAHGFGTHLNSILRLGPAWEPAESLHVSSSADPRPLLHEHEPALFLLQQSWPKALNHGGLTQNQRKILPSRVSMAPNNFPEHRVSRLVDFPNAAILKTDTFRFAAGRTGHN